MADVTALPVPGRVPGLHKRITQFVRLLRENGFPVGLPEVADAERAALCVDVSRPHEIRWALRALLTASVVDWRRFDELFDAFWHRRGMKRVTRVGGEMQGRGVRKLPGAGAPAGTTGPADRVERGGDSDAVTRGDGEVRREGASSADSLAAKDLRYINDPEELARAHDLADRLAARMRYRLTRRERIKRRGRQLDLRRTIHRSIPYGGTPMRLAFRRRWPKPLKLVVILDASGSMSQYSAFFVRFIHGILDNFHDADAFVFHTRLVHIGRALRDRNPTRALERLSLMVTGWSGGTRIGDCLADFNRNHAAGVINSRTVVMIVCDGYDTGSSERLAQEMARLKKRTRRIVWLNPMLGWRDYEPVAVGMQAALPHVDLFAPAHNLDSLMALEPYLVRL